MASLLWNRGINAQLIGTIRRLSSYNRSKIGIVSLVQSEDFGIWSEKYWSEFGKQFNKSIDFPLPGQTGTVLEEDRANCKKIKETNANKTNIICENLNYLLTKPLAQENQLMKLKEAAGGMYYQDKMEQELFTSEDLKNLKPNFEMKAHKCPKSLMLDFQNYFRLHSLNDAPLTVITISFKTEHDMATWNAEVDSERELLMQKYVETASKLCASIEKSGHWADFIDPSSGRPYKSPYSHATFYETDERYRHLGFEIVDYGCCKVISHHQWGTKTYVGCLLTTADLASNIVRELTQ